MEEKGVFSVWRGKELLTIDSRVVEWGSTIEGDESIDTADLLNCIHGLQLHSKYSDSDNVVSFHANKKIRMLGCEFFRPLPTKSVDTKAIQLKVCLRIDMVWKSAKKNPDLVRTKTLSEKEEVLVLEQSQGSHTFSVYFDEPVDLDPNAIKYDLVFRIYGPPTYELDPAKLHKYAESGDVTLFFWPGSKQLPAILFRVPEEDLKIN